MKFERGITVDGTYYSLPLVSLKRSAEFLDKFAERSEDGVLQRDLIGVYYNFTLTAGTSNAFESDYDAFWEHMTQPVEFHDFTLPYGTKGESYSFRGYISSVSDEYSKILENSAVFSGFTCKMTAQSPARRPG